MDNTDKIKFKEAANNWYVKIFLDKNGNELSRTPAFKNGKGSGSGLYKEMKAWESAGNGIEPQYTESELAEKEEQENMQALENQKAICKNLLNMSEIHVSSDPPYPDDVEAWKTARKEWRKILKSDILQEIYPKPF